MRLAIIFVVSLSVACVTGCRKDSGVPAQTHNPRFTVTCDEVEVGHVNLCTVRDTVTGDEFLVIIARVEKEPK